MDNLKRFPADRSRLENYIGIISENLFCALLIFIPISNSAVEILAVCLMVLFVIKKIIKPDFGFMRSWIYACLAIFLIFNALSIVNSGPHLKISLRAFLGKWCEYAAIFIIAHDMFLNDRRRVKRAILVMFATSAVVCVDGIWQLVFGSDFIRQKVMRPMAGISSVFGNQNSLAAYIVPVLLLAIAMAACRQSGNRFRAALSLLSAILIACLTMTYSRAGFVGVVCGLIVFVTMSKDYRYAVAVTALVIIGLLCLSVLSHDNLFVFKFTGDAKRLGIINASLHMVKENPFIGKGVGTFMEHLSSNSLTGDRYYAHNCFLQIWVETGIFGLLSFIAFLLLSLSGMVSRHYKNTDCILLGLICAACGFLANSFFDVQFYSFRLAILFWAIFGMGCSFLESPKHIPG